VVFGDSVVLGARESLKAVMGEISIDAAVSRQPEEIAERNEMTAQAELERIAREKVEADRLAAQAAAKEKLAALGLTAEEIAAITGA
jgi:hypothetical protein